jgi:hypothetical protein
MGFGFVTPPLGRSLDLIQARPQRFIDDRPKWFAQFGRNSSGTV